MQYSGATRYLGPTHCHGHGVFQLHLRLQTVYLSVVIVGWYEQFFHGLHYFVDHTPQKLLVEVGGSLRFILRHGRERSALFHTLSLDNIVQCKRYRVGICHARTAAFSQVFRAEPCAVVPDTPAHHASAFGSWREFACVLDAEASRC